MLEYQKLDPKIFYVRDLKVQVDGQEFDGVGVIPAKGLYRFKLRSSGKMDLLVIETCHREISIEKAGFSEGYIYRPVPGMEDKPNCAIIKFSSFEKGSKGRHAEAMLIMENPAFKLEARLRCNGKYKKFNGTSLCHSKEYLYHEIEFDELVDIYETRCSLESPNGVRKIKFAMYKRDCRFTFKGRTSGKLHILYTSGYEQILLRN